MAEDQSRLLPDRILTQKPGGATAIDLNYQYDLRGKISSISDGALTNNNRSFTYDALGQLDTATGPWGTQVNTYDPLGNILSRVMSGGAEGDRTISLDYDPVRNRVTQSIDSQAAGSAWGGTGTGTRAIGHDARGNVTSLGSMSFVYDYSDQPVTVNGSRNGTAFNASSFTYDGNLKRVKSVINGRTIYNIYSLSGKLVHVEDEDPLDGGLPERTDYLDFGGMSIARVRVGQGTIYTHADHLGSPVAQTYSGGALATQTRYSPFGIALDDPNLLKDHGGFTGHIKDSATGLNYMQARYYDPVMGRFLSVDPVTFLDTGDPGMFNRYAYTWNDPINGIDPNGEYRKAVWTSATTVEVTIPVAVKDRHGISTYSSQDLADEVSKRFTGTTMIDGVEVTVTTTGVAVSPDSKGRYPRNTNIQKAKRGEGTARARVGGTTSKVYPAVGDDVVIGAHEIGHNAGAKDQYDEGTDSNGNRMTTAKPGFENTIMGDGRGNAHPDTLKAIISSSKNTTCAEGVSAANGAC